MEAIALALTVLGAISSLQSINVPLDAFIDLLKTTRRGYNEDICGRTALMKAILEEMVKYARKSSHIDKRAITHFDALSKKVESLNKHVSNDKSLERFRRHGTIDGELKDLQNMVQFLWTFM